MTLDPVTRAACAEERVIANGRWKAKRNTGKQLRVWHRHPLHDALLLSLMMQQVDMSGSCWEWKGLKHAHRGYGLVTYKDRTTTAHRVMYMLLGGPVEKGQVVDHLCRNRGCVNPEHMEAVSPAVNALRGVSFAAVNARKRFCSHGHGELLVKIGNNRRCPLCYKETMLNASRRFEAKHKERRSARHKKRRCGGSEA